MNLGAIKGTSAVRATREECLGARVVYSPQLIFHRPIAQGRRAFDVEHATTPAAAETEAAMILHFVQVDAHDLHECPWRLIDTAFAHRHAGILEGAQIADGDAQFKVSGLQLICEVLGHMKHTERQRLAVEVSGFPAQRRVRLTALRDEQNIGLEGNGLID